jgi:hypothetical protein
VHSAGIWLWMARAARSYPRTHFGAVRERILDARPIVRTHGAAHSAMNSPHASFDFRFIYETIVLVPFVEGVSGDKPESDRDRRPAGWLVTTPPGGTGNPPSATTSGRAKSQTMKPDCFIPRGTGRQ